MKYRKFQYILFKYKYLAINIFKFTIIVIIRGEEDSEKIWNHFLDSESLEITKGVIGIA